MKHLPVIFITLSIILSVIACILPNWAAQLESSSNTGLFNRCVYDTFRQRYICAPTTVGHGLLLAKIFSIAGPVLLAISAVICGMGQHKYLILATLVGGIACLTATLVIFATSYAPSICPPCLPAPAPGPGPGPSPHLDCVKTDCPSLSISWYLELGAVILAIVGVVIKARSSTNAII